ncbi:hypothetical protein ACNPQM_28310 [Streptomyces sp. NPDC056231]|uniref:hypothetical protein n=1 Tax=Streptomyces sp. NPDC056231 TaxID=3345755 RepID=UPI003AAB5526
MPGLTTRIADWAHRGLGGTAERLAIGHQVLIAAASDRLVRRPAPLKPAAEEAPAPRKRGPRKKARKAKEELEREKAPGEEEVPGGRIPVGDRIDCHRTEGWSDMDSIERWVTAVIVAMVLVFLAYQGF